MIKVFINKLNRLCNLFFGLASWIAMEYVFCEALPWKFMKKMLQTFADHWHTARRSYSTHSWIFRDFYVGQIQCEVDILSAFNQQNCI